MPTTHRSELVTKIADALTDEAYDGGMGVLSEEQFAQLVRTLAITAAEVVEKAHTPTDDEREALGTVIAITWRDAYGTPTDQEFADAILAAGFRRSEVPEPSAERELTPCGNLVCTGCRVCGCPALGIEPQGESADALPLDPQPWVFVSDQVFGVRSATDEGFHAVSGAYHAFQPRREYEQDRARYESAGGAQ